VESVTGPPRKYFVMTDEGNAAFATLLNTWNEMTGSVQALIQNTNPIASSETNQVS
jgi:PadR family transcriptional regulator PadR